MPPSPPQSLCMRVCHKSGVNEGANKMSQHKYAAVTFDVCVCAYIHVCVHLCVHVCVCACVCVCVCMYLVCLFSVGV